MTIKSALHKGLQRRGGDSARDCSITIDKTSGLDVTIRAGDLGVSGTTCALSADETHTLPSDPDNETAVLIGLRRPSDPTTYLRSSVAGVDRSHPPRPDDHIDTLVGWEWCVVPAGASDLSGVDIYTWSIMDNSVRVVVDGAGNALAFAGPCEADDCSDMHPFTEIEHSPRPRGPNQPLYIDPDATTPTPTVDAAGVDHPVQIKTVE